MPVNPDVARRIDEEGQNAASTTNEDIRARPIRRPLNLGAEQRPERPKRRENKRQNQPERPASETESTEADDPVSRRGSSNTRDSSFRQARLLLESVNPQASPQSFALLRGFEVLPTLS